MSSMSSFYVPDNQFNGTLPPNIGLTLPNIKEFGIAGNNFSGIIPESFSNASKLQILDIGENNFVGQVPSSLGYLPDLYWLSLAYNNLGSYMTNSLDFIASLTNCSNLEILDLHGNNFGGVFPKHVANLSTQLTGFYLGGNQVSGNISATLGNLVNLIILGLEYNLLEGVIPASLGKLRNLQTLKLEWNTLSGKIPSSMGNLTKIFDIDLSGNKLEGSIPFDIANCQMLQNFDISNNNLTGAIPNELFALSSSFLRMNLSRNSFSGSLPLEVGKLKNIHELDISENNLTSEIPKTIGDCESMEFLLLQGNFLQSTIPSTLASLRGLQYLDLSRNNLIGKIPNGLEKLLVLTYLNLSFNDLEGEVPKKGVFQNTSAIILTGNTKLCGGVPKLELPACPIRSSKKQQRTKRLKLTIVMVCVAAFSLMFSSFLIFYWRRKSTRKSCSTLSTISFNLSRVSYKRLYQATGGFSPSMLIGTGSFGSVYKGILDDEENPVAVKVLNLQQKGACKSFIVECNALRNIRHKNLIKILTLHYLHDHCEQPIIHCDLKPSNVLLDNEMIAHVGDFGLARLMPNTSVLSESQTSTIGLNGTIGYVPPEYAMGGEPSKQGDMYSYGTLMLEIFTGKRPTDEMFKDDFNLHNFVKMALPERIVQVVDSALLSIEVEETTTRREDGRRFNNDGAIEINTQSPNRISIRLEKCLFSVLEIGLACSEEPPNERMNMGDVFEFTGRDKEPAKYRNSKLFYTEKSESEELLRCVPLLVENKL
ncbi:GPCR kinase [Parasponia andersonii]|uniref:non-specific serine/threonine protein kinase n=1 Tax=Parasponia andersonii TaxID=3476 RepID=A0A2P5DTX3_PARAD|nr:GPCR kinase [Parasponia andersonii]